MFEFIRTHRRLMHILLLLFIVPSFAFVGIQSYSRFSDDHDIVAKVAGQSITQQEWENGQRQQIERLRQMFGDQFDTKIFDTPEAKQSVLENLIAQRAMSAEAARKHLTVSDQSLQQTILAIPGLADANGKFDVERYKSLLAAQGMEPVVYQERLRQDLTLQQVNAAVQSTAFAPKTVAGRLSDLNDQEREVQELAFKASDFSSQVKITDEMLKAYYDANGKQFEIPEQAKIEYVVLDSGALAAQTAVSDDDAKSYYEQNAKHYTVEEQRRASHILIAVKKGASDADKTSAKTKAEQLLARLRKNPSEFAKLAKENSQDPGSAERGGDLDFFGRGMMLKPFEDAVYQLKKGEISDVVATEFGYHIIQLTDIKPASVKSFDEVKGEISAEIKKQKAAKKYAELAELFTNTVYEQADSLKPAADKLGLKIETASNVSRTQNAAPNAPINNPKFLQALFSDDAIKNKRNTEAIEIAPNTLISGRIVEYKPISKRPFEEVKAEVRERVLRTEAAKLAVKAGEAKVAELKAKPEAASGFGEAKTVSRVKSQAVNGLAVAAIMKADASKLPAFVGVELPGQGYGVYRINKIAQPATPDTARRQTEQQQISNALAQQEMSAYIDALKKKAKVKLLHAGAGKTETTENK
jgi:peptidyl-prolyl cis-trans isomerase D